MRNCTICAYSKGNRNKYDNTPVKALEVSRWSNIAVDTLGPLAGENHWRALTIIDTSTRLMEITSMEHGTSAEAARIVVEV